jgi:hypothetical protein
LESGYNCAIPGNADSVMAEMTDPPGKGYSTLVIALRFASGAVWQAGYFNYHEHEFHRAFDALVLA